MGDQIIVIILLGQLYNTDSQVNNWCRKMTDRQLSRRVGGRVVNSARKLLSQKIQIFFVVDLSFQPNLLGLVRLGRRYLGGDPYKKVRLG
jgi:hypothetical protein